MRGKDNVREKEEEEWRDGEIEEGREEQVREGWRGNK